MAHRRGRLVLAIWLGHRPGLELGCMLPRVPGRKSATLQSKSVSLFERLRLGLQHPAAVQVVGCEARCVLSRGVASSMRRGVLLRIFKALCRVVARLEGAMKGLGAQVPPAPSVRLVSSSLGRSLSGLPFGVSSASHVLVVFPSGPSLKQGRCFTGEGGMLGAAMGQAWARSSCLGSANLVAGLGLAKLPFEREALPSALHSVAVLMFEVRSRLGRLWISDFGSATESGRRVPSRASRDRVRPEFWSHFEFRCRCPAPGHEGLAESWPPDVPAAAPCECRARATVATRCPRC